MNLYKRGMIFVTFLGSCLGIALVAAALGTKHWVTSRARRTPNPSESDGVVHLGLFYGDKDLNVAYGWRNYPFTVVDTMRSDPSFMVYSYWLTTVACLSLSLLFAAVAAVFAVINTATTPIGALTGVPGLYLWNIATLVFQCTSIGFWIAQFYERLQYNVLGLEEKSNYWTSHGMASFGFSFWLAVGAAVVHFANILFIYFGTRESRAKAASIPVLEEKGNGAIMLY
uniref:MARVEL domain-containing protein n=1 Tax=Graphocephala atropunctata TaxID=36148 RepID=A0A1B6LYA0_9HEMI